MEIKEEWRWIAGYEGVYKISSFGRVMNKDGLIRNNQSNGNGYKIIKLYRNGKGKKFYIHRLVAEAFIPNPRSVEFVNHKDESRDNNRVDNLEWVTREENLKYGTAPERQRKVMEARRGNPFPPLYKKVRCVETCEIFESEKHACKKHNIHPGNLSACLHGRRKTAGGYRWEFEKEN